MLRFCSDDFTINDVITIFWRHVTNVFRKMASDNVNEQRVVIKFYTLLEKSFSDIPEDLHTVYGDSCISKSAISKWMNCFKEGRDTTKSDKRKGRPVTVLNERKVAEIQEYILEDRRVTVENVAEHYGISYGTAQDIMSNKLGMRRVSARWVPRLLLPEQMGVRVKICNEYCRQYKDEGDTFLNRVVTCAETWIHFFETESKETELSMEASFFAFTDKSIDFQVSRQSYGHNSLWYTRYNP